MRLVFSEIVVDGVADRPPPQASSGCASGLNHSRNAGFHFALINKLSPVRLLQAFVHGGAAVSKDLFVRGIFSGE